MKCICRTDEPREPKVVIRNIISPSDEDFNEDNEEYIDWYEEYGEDEEDGEYHVMIYYDIVCKECRGIIEGNLCDVYDFEELEIVKEFVEKIKKRKLAIEQICELYTEIVGED